MESAKTRKTKTRVTLSVCLAVNEGKRKEEKGEREKIGKEMKKEYASFLHFWKKWGKRKENK